jgi:hypothetical protein
VLRLFLFTPYILGEFMDRNISLVLLVSSTNIFSVSGDLYLPELRIAVSDLKELDSDINSLAVCSNFYQHFLDYIAPKFIYASIKFCNILSLTISLKFINFAFKIFTLFVLELCTSFSPYIVQVISICLAQIL